MVDTVDDAIVVFSPAGELVLSNAAYDELWGVEPALTLGKVTILDSIRRWQELARPDPAFGDIRDFVASIGERAEWTAGIRLVTGEMLACRIVPMPGGATLVGFGRQRSDRPQFRRAPRSRRTEAADATESLGV